MLRYLVGRLMMSVITLWILATIVFLMVNVLPADVARTVLGPFASPESVDALNAKLGLDQPLLERYLHSLRGLATFDFGDSYASGQPATPMLLAAMGRSLLLAGLALAITVPLGIVAGLAAALWRNRPFDTLVSTISVSTAAIPSFVTGTLLVVLVGVRLGWLPVLATPPPGVGALEQMRYLLLPALSLTLVYFGYIARMMRASAVDALEADYSRTATMKGVSTPTLLRKHIVRNAMIPTVAVIAVQAGYLFGGIVAVEKIFNYNGMGQTLLFAAQAKDLPVLTAGVLLVAIVYIAASLIADFITAWLDPRIRIGKEN